MIRAAVNFPGSWHDRKLAITSGLIFPKLSDDTTSPVYAILGDSAFVINSGKANYKIVRSRKTNEINSIPESLELVVVDTILQSVMPSDI